MSCSASRRSGTGPARKPSRRALSLAAVPRRASAVLRSAAGIGWAMPSRTKRVTGLLHAVSTPAPARASSTASRGLAPNGSSTQASAGSHSFRARPAVPLSNGGRNRARGPGRAGGRPEGKARASIMAAALTPHGNSASREPDLQAQACPSRRVLGNRDPAGRWLDVQQAERLIPGPHSAVPCAWIGIGCLGSEPARRLVLVGGIAGLSSPASP